MVSYMCQSQLSSPMLPSDGADAALRRDRVRARREHLRQHRDRQARFGELQRGAHAGAAGADDDRVEPAHRRLHRLMPHKHVDRPAEVADQRDDHDDLQREAEPSGFT